MGVLVVTEKFKRHPCIQWFEQHPLRKNISIAVQSNSIWKDYCLLAGAPNVVVAPSSFSQTAAILGKTRNIFLVGSADKNALLDCKTRPGTQVWKYHPEAGATKDFNRTKAGLAAYLRSYPWQRVLGPRPCGTKAISSSSP